MIQVTLKRSKKLRLGTKLQAAFQRLKDSSVTVGVHADAGSYPAKSGSGPTVAEVANWLEYGTETMPKRSFMQSTIDENNALIQRITDRAIVNVAVNGWTVQKALSRIGAQVLRAIQNKVKSNVAPPLSEAYLARKLKAGMPARTLIATGKLLSSLAYKVLLGGEAIAESQQSTVEGAPPETSAKTGNQQRRAEARQNMLAKKAANRQARKTFASDPAKQARYAAQQATKKH